MVSIVASITTTKGLDTKYLFAGSTPHVATSLAGRASHMVYSQSRYVEQAAVPDPRHNFTFDVIGSGFTLSSSRDFFGQIESWTVVDSSVPGDGVLGQVSISTFGTVSPPNLTSFAMLTPDTAVGAYVAAGNPVNLFLIGNDGRDTLRGSFWADVLNGGSGRDTMIGGDGNDAYTVDNRNDKIIEEKGNGIDSVSTMIKTYTLGANLENLAASGSVKFELTGNARNNSITGSKQADTISTLGGNDTILSGGGKDVVFGGGGKDSFFFTGPGSGADADRIMDFSHKDDTIQLLKFGFASLPATGPLAADMFRASNNGQAHDANDVVLYDKNDGRLYYDGDGDGAGARILLAIFAHAPTVTAADILVV